jgi:inorganic pyrophosphatase
MNLYHDIAPGTVDKMNVIIEIPKGSKNKYEIDKETGIIALDRVNSTSQDYPFEYGFVPQTLWGDGDALDVILLATYPVFPGVLVRARPIALMGMLDTGQEDDKIIAVPCDDPRWNDVKDLKDLNAHTLRELEHFHVTYKNLLKKEVLIKDFAGKAKAEEAFAKGIKMYKEAKK